MQLGTRWAMGSEPPARLPEEVTSAIRDVENSVVGDPARSADTEASGRRWTLTWLEGRPIVELDPAAGSEEIFTILFNPSTHTITMRAIGPGDEWVEE